MLLLCCGAMLDVLPLRWGSEQGWDSSRCICVGAASAVAAAEHAKW
jgi:hypothetical protein